MSRIMMKATTLVKKSGGNLFDDLRDSDTVVKASPAKVGGSTHPTDASFKLAEMVKELARMQAENEALKAARGKGTGGGISCKVSAKGGVSVYGLGRFPVTLYAPQWAKLLKGATPENNEVLAFIEANDGKDVPVKVKDEAGNVTGTTTIRFSKADNRA